MFLSPTTIFLPVIDAGIDRIKKIFHQIRLTCDRVTETVQQGSKMTLRQTILSILAILSISVLAGCGAGPQALDEASIQKSTDNAKLARSLFESSKGDWNALSPEDKKKLSDAYGSEKAAETVWATMKNPPMGSQPAPGQ